MKVGLAIYNFDPKKGGAERYTFDLSKMLKKRGHDVFVVCSRGILLNGLNIIRVNTLKFPRWLRTLSFALEHRKIIKSLGLDIILGFGNTIEVDVYQSHGGVHKVWMSREIESYENPVEKNLKAIQLKTSIHQKIQQWISEYPLKNKKYDRIIAISDMVKTHMMEAFSIPPENIEVVYNGVDVERFRPHDKKTPEGKIKLLFSAGNFRLKGLYPLLEALEKLSKKRDDFLLFVMGRGKKDRYLKLIREKGLKKHVIFIGETSQPEMVYREMDVSVHPTFYDACSLTTMEAMASGLPVITTKWNGASGLITEKEGYIMDEPRDLDRLCLAIEELMDREKRVDMGKNARCKIESFTMEKNAREIERVLKEAIDGKTKN